tara:strand:+ start:1037 stop:1189 length:153 start_codon:yes stop_codon:yes gene_type:complete
MEPISLFVLFGGAYALYTVGMAIATEMDYRAETDRLRKENDRLLSNLNRD